MSDNPGDRLAHNVGEALTSFRRAMGVPPETGAPSRCNECGATVDPDDFAFHSAWHGHLDQMIRIASGDKAAMRATRASVRRPKGKS